MPKAKKKGRNDRHRVESPPSDDDSYGNDNSSVASSVSDIHSVMEEGESVAADETVQVEDFEDQVKDAIDGATQKSAKGRENSLQSLVKAFSNKLIPHFINNRYSTITDVIERSLRKGRGEEQGLAATLGVLLCVQLGPCPETEEIFRNLKPMFITILSDNSAASKARAKCAMALGLCTFIVNEDPTTLQEIMRSLESAFRGSYFKGDGSSPTVSVEMSTLHSSALAAWSLLLSILSPYQIAEMVDSHLSRLPELLDSSDLELRIVAGETIALFYELARNSETFEGVDLDELCIKLKQLATDSHKYRARKDRKQQRSSFRDILQAVEGIEDADGKTLSLNIKFGRESVELDSWVKKRQYDAFCTVLGSGMNHHLTENELLRDVFELGAPLGNDAPISRVSKGERHFANMAAFKSRTIIRNKFRDKRSVVLS